MKNYTVILISLFCGFIFNINAQQPIKLDTSFYSQALDSIRMVDIWLPSDYYDSTDVDYPVIFYLHSAGGNQNEGFKFANTYYSRYYEDTLHADSVPPAIIISPDGSCQPYLGSFWVNSDLYGNYEEYIITDVINFLESNFRVMNDKNFRFITGYSMGGFGSTYLAIRHPELFRGCAPSSAAHLSYPDTLMNEWIYRLHNENGGYHFSYNAGPVTRLFFTASGGFVPNLDIEPNHFELLWDTLGNFVDTVFTKWQNFDCCNLIESITPEDSLSFFLTCGTNDMYLCYPPYEELEDSLESLDIDCQTYYHGYNHSIFDPVAHTIMSHWIDSLIAESYDHEPNQNIFDPVIYNQATFHVYPNPFSTSTTIEYELTQPKNVTVKIFNQFGQQIENINQGNLQTGQHQYIWNASGLTNGIYYVQVRAGQEVSTSKIVKMR